VVELERQHNRKKTKFPLETKLKKNCEETFEFFNRAVRSMKVGEEVLILFLSDILVIKGGATQHNNKRIL
jgi:hypothetical protein